MRRLVNYNRVDKAGLYKSTRHPDKYMNFALSRVVNGQGQSKHFIAIDNLAKCKMKFTGHWLPYSTTRNVTTLFTESSQAINFAFKFFATNLTSHFRFLFLIFITDTIGQCNVMHNVTIITKTSPCNEDPLTPNFYIVKLGLTGVRIISLILL